MDIHYTESEQSDLTNSQSETPNTRNTPNKTEKKQKKQKDLLITVDTTANTNVDLIYENDENAIIILTCEIEPNYFEKHMIKIHLHKNLNLIVSNLIDDDSELFKNMKSFKNLKIDKNKLYTDIDIIPYKQIDKLKYSRIILDTFDYYSHILINDNKNIFAIYFLRYDENKHSFNSIISDRHIYPICSCRSYYSSGLQHIKPKYCNHIETILPIIYLPSDILSWHSRPASLPHYLKSINVPEYQWLPDL